MSPNLSTTTTSQFIKALQKNNFIKTRQSGSHAIYKRKADDLIVVVAIHSPGKTIPIGTLKRMIKDAGWTAAEFLKIIS